MMPVTLITSIHRKFKVVVKCVHFLSFLLEPDKWPELLWWQIWYIDLSMDLDIWSSNKWLENWIELIQHLMTCYAQKQFIDLQLSTHFDILFVCPSYNCYTILMLQTHVLLFYHVGSVIQWKDLKNQVDPMEPWYLIFQYQPPTWDFGGIPWVLTQTDNRFHTKIFRDFADFETPLTSQTHHGYVRTHTLSTPAVYPLCNKQAETC